MIIALIIAGAAVLGVVAYLVTFAAFASAARRDPLGPGRGGGVAARIARRVAGLYVHR